MVDPMEITAGTQVPVGTCAGSPFVRPLWLVVGAHKGGISIISLAGSIVLPEHLVAPVGIDDSISSARPERIDDSIPAPWARDPQFRSRKDAGALGGLTWTLLRCGTQSSLRA